MAILSLAILLGGVLMQAIRPHRLDIDDTVQLCVFLLLFWAGVQVPLWMVRWFLRMWIARASTSDASRRPLQFRLIHLMALTLLVGLLFGLGPPLLGVLGGAEVEVLVLFLASTALVATTTSLTTFLPSYWQCGVAIAGAYALLVGWTQYALLDRLTGMPTQEELVVALTTGWSYVWLQASLLLVRFAGYGLESRAARLPVPSP